MVMLENVSLYKKMSIQVLGATEYQASNFHIVQGKKFVFRIYFHLVHKFVVISKNLKFI